MTKIFIVFIGFFAGLLSAYAQNLPGSPYTYFGIGDIYQKGAGHHLMKGGTGLADRSAFAINNLNPASYSAMSSRYTYLYEFGASVAAATRSGGGNDGRQLALDFPYLMMAFKTGGKSGGSVGLRKYSNVNYDIVGSGQFTGVPSEYRVRYQGSGGLNEAYFGFGRTLGQRLSVGFHASYIFGTIDHTQQINSSNINSRISIRDENFLRTFNLDVGAQYALPLGRSTLTLGATYDPRNGLSSRRDLLIAETGSSGGGVSTDTLAREALENEDYLLPHALGVGISWNRNNQFALSADVQTQWWSESPLEGDDFRLRDSRRVALGFEKLPNGRARSYRGHVRWSVGVYAEQSYLVLGEEGLDNTGITLGLGFPLGDRAILRLAAERTSRGQSLEDFFAESYTKLTLNLTFLDGWFKRRKFE